MLEQFLSWIFSSWIVFAILAVVLLALSDMKRNPTHRFLLLLISAVTLVTASNSACAADNRPNIVYIVADDLDWKDVGFNGATDIKTPNLDKLAQTGARLEQFDAQSLCTPTRAALLTGRYPNRPSGYLSSNMNLL